MGFLLGFLNQFILNHRKRSLNCHKPEGRIKKEIIDSRIFLLCNFITQIRDVAQSG